MAYIKECNNCIHQGATGLNYMCGKCVALSMFSWKCSCCALKLPEGSGKYCQCDDGDDGFSCCGDKFELDPNGTNKAKRIPGKQQRLHEVLFKHKPTGRWITIDEHARWKYSDKLIPGETDIYIYEYVNEVMADLKIPFEEIEIIEGPRAFLIQTIINISNN